LTTIAPMMVGFVTKCVILYINSNYYRLISHLSCGLKKPRAANNDISEPRLSALFIAKFAVKFI